VVEAASVYAHRQGWTAMAVALLLSLAAPGGAAAVTYPTQQIDGPSSDIIELGGVAMAEDGTGGLVYLKRDGPRPHVFAARFVDGAWTAPVRVDRPGPLGTQAFASSWPRIGAGEGGRLVVTWVQELGENSDRLFSASLDPGATRFQDPVPIDLNVGEATATHPSLEMNGGGQAYLSYRIVNRAGALPPDFVNSDTRIARYNGAVWTVLGSLADRNPSTPTRTPTELNSPEVGIDFTGGGIIAFQEPDDEFIDRIYARRLFGTSQGVPLLVSPQKFGAGCTPPPAQGTPAPPGGSQPGAQQPGTQPTQPADGQPSSTRQQEVPPADCRPLRAPADQFSLDVAGFGQGAVAFRQQPGERSGLAETRVFVNTIPEAFNEQAGRFREARLADGQVAGGIPGPASVAVTPAGVFEVAFGRSNATYLADGDDNTLADPTIPFPPPERIDDGSSTAAGDPVVELGPTGAGTTAWKTDVGGAGTVSVRERLVDGTGTVGASSASRGGPVTQLMSAGSGLGDAIVAFRQGGESFNQIASSVVDVPPDQFGVLTPEGFQRVRTVPISWDPAPDALGGLTYAVKLDGDVVAENLTERKIDLTEAQLGDGIHLVQIVARDRSGQTADSFEGEVMVDRTPPRARASGAPRRLVRVRVSDGPVSRASGAVAGATSIAFGDGRRTNRKTTAANRYRRAGTYRVVVRTRDAAGNRATRRLKVRVR